MKTISIADDFSSAPAGRFPDDGPYNGTRFRDEFLLPALRSGEDVVVSLDGVSGFGSSFLEEAFGGLVRVHHINRDDLLRRLTVSYSDSALVFYADSIVDFIQDAIEE